MRSQTGKAPVTPWVMTGLAVPFAWAMVYPVDVAVMFYHGEGLLFFEVCSAVTSLGFFVALLFSPYDTVRIWRGMPKKGRRILFAIGFIVAVSGTLAMSVLEVEDMLDAFHMAQIAMFMAWVTMPFLTLAGNRNALGFLVSSMHLGMLWWCAFFWLETVGVGTPELLNDVLPLQVLAFLAITYVWFLYSARRLLALKQGEWPVCAPGWQWRYWTGFALAYSLVMVWAFTGFTNDGDGFYGGVEYSLMFPFYDVAAILDPVDFANGYLLLLHSVPWDHLLLQTTTGARALTGMYGTGLACLFAATLGAFGVLYTGLRLRSTLVYAALAIVAAGATVWQIVAIWIRFAACSPEVVRTLACIDGQMDKFILNGQYIWALGCCALTLVLAVALAVMTLRQHRREPRNSRQADVYV
jgi:hypothetical protein